jgi:hypothetical protein
MVNMRNLMAEEYNTGHEGANGTMGAVGDLTRGFLYRNLPGTADEVEHELAVTNILDFIGVVPQVCATRVVVLFVTRVVRLFSRCSW